MKEIQKRLRERKDSQKGFTLVELMIVIAIIAILAAVAITQYSSYKNKAKAKDLVGFARGCAMEIVAQCEADPDFNAADVNQLESCAVSSNGTKYLTNVSVSPSFSGCGNNFTVTATGQVGSNGPVYLATCSYNPNEGVSCTAPKKQ